MGWECLRPQLYWDIRKSGSDPGKCHDESKAQLGAPRLILAESASTDPNTFFSCQVQPRQTQTFVFLVRLCLERPKRHFCLCFALACEREALAKVSFGPVEAELGKIKMFFACRGKPWQDKNCVCRLSLFYLIWQNLLRRTKHTFLLIAHFARADVWLL